MEGNILDDKDRAYLVELLSNLGENNDKSKIDRMGTRRDDIPGGKNSMYLDSKTHHRNIKSSFFLERSKSLTS